MECGSVFVAQIALLLSSYVVVFGDTESNTVDIPEAFDSVHAPVQL